MRIALLDDYQRLAKRLVDWSAVEARASVTVFDRHLDEEAAVHALRDFDAVCHLRERMAMPRSLIARLPNLRFIGITGHEHRTLDLAAATERGITVACALSSTAVSNSNTLVYSNSVLGCGFAALSVAKNGSMCSFFIFNNRGQIPIITLCNLPIASTM